MEMRREQSKIPHVTSEELLKALDHTSFEQPLSYWNEARWAESVAQTRSILERHSLNIAPSEYAYNIVNDVCKQVSRTINEKEDDADLQRLKQTSEFSEIRKRLGLRIAIRLRLCNHPLYSRFINFIKQNPNCDESLIAVFNSQTRPETSDSSELNLRATIAGIRIDYCKMGEDENLFWELLCTFLSEQSGVKVVAIKRKNENQKGNRLVTNGVIESGAASDEKDTLLQPVQLDELAELLVAEPEPGVAPPAVTDTVTDAVTDSPTSTTITPAATATVPPRKKTPELPDYDEKVVQERALVAAIAERGKREAFGHRKHEREIFNTYSRLKKEALAKALATDEGVRAAIALFIPRRLFQNSTIGAHYSYNDFLSTLHFRAKFNPFLLLDFPIEQFNSIVDQFIGGDDADETQDDGSDFEVSERTTAKTVVRLCKKILATPSEEREEHITELIDAILKVGPNPLMIQKLREKNGLPDADDDLQELSRHHQKIQKPYIRNIAFFANSQITKGRNADTALANGALAILRCVDTFDVRTGVPFWEFINQRMNAVTTRSWDYEQAAIAIPSHVTVTIKAIWRHVYATGRDLSDFEPAELSAALDIPQKKIETALTAMKLHHLDSLDEPRSDSDDRTLLDRHHTETPEPFDQYESLQQIIAWCKAANLTAREQQVIVLRFAHECDLKETGRILKRADGESSGLTAERARQIGVKAINKLKLYFKKHGITSPEGLVKVPD